MDTYTQAKAGVHTAVTEVLASVSGVMRQEVRRQGNVTTDVADLNQAAAIGVINALVSFDATKGYTFATHCRLYVRDEVSRAVAEARQGFLVPNTTAKRYFRAVRNADTHEEAVALAVDEGMDPATFMAARQALTRTFALEGMGSRNDDATEDEGGFDVPDEADHATDIVSHAANIASLERALCVLQPRERMVIEMSYGLAGHPTDLTDSAVARAIGVDRTRVVRIRKAAMVKMAEVLAEAHT